MNIADHYERLGVSPTATREDIRIAYRDLARRFHPDAKGDASAGQMAEINEAWRVLSDPARRAVYDAMYTATPVGSSAAGAREPATTSAPVAPRPVPPTAPYYVAPARFPWRLMLVLGCLGVAFVLINAAFTKPAKPDKPDNLIQAGSCVDIADNGDAVEVLCNGLNQGVVQSLIPFGSVCDQGTEGHRDRQGMGQVCVRFANNG